MRILVATDHWFPEHRGGAARVAAETAALLARRGHAVDVLAPAASGLPALTRDGSLAVHRVLRRSPIPQTLADPWRTYLAARGRTADVAVAHTSTTAAGLAAACPETPLVLVFHASAPREVAFERSCLPRGRRRAALRALEPCLRVLETGALERAARVLVLSEYSRGLIAADHPQLLERTRLVRGGVDTGFFTPGTRDDARARLGVPVDRQLLVTVRRLEPRMGLELLLEAVASLHGAHPRLALEIVGDGSLRKALEEQRRRLRLADVVRFAGRVPEDELIDWYRAADLFVLPTIAYEGFGLVTAEALSCGTPVVGTLVGATPELLGPLDERLLARRPTAAAIAAVVERGLELATPELRRRSRAYAESSLSWDAVLPGWEAALAGLPDVRPARAVGSRRLQGRRGILGSRR